MSTHSDDYADKDWLRGEAPPLSRREWALISIIVLLGFALGITWMHPEILNEQSSSGERFVAHDDSVEAADRVAQAWAVTPRALDAAALNSGDCRESPAKFLR